MSGCGCEPEPGNERSLLLTLLAINALMFGVELAAGIAADSAGLLADSLDMLADATVYGSALAAAGRTTLAKARTALLTGVFQLGLAVWVAAEVLSRFFGGSEPQSAWMVGVGGLALAANVLCFALLMKHRKGEIHLRASFICSSNDVLANLGVILGGVLVAVTGSPLPDLLIGVIVVTLVVRGGLRIAREASREIALSRSGSAA